MAREPATALTLTRPKAAAPTPRALPLRGLTPPAAAEVAGRELWAGIHLSAPDTDRLQRLALHAELYTPRVSLEPPDGVLLEVQGSLHLF